MTGGGLARISNGRVGSTGVAAAIVGLVAFFVRLPGALHDSFWQDEVSSARSLQAPTFGRMLSHVVRAESTPPLWFALGWVVHRCGVSIHDVRLLSVLFGGILAAVVVLVARAVLPLMLAVLAGTLVAVGGYFVAHGHELRAYELLALLTVVFALALESHTRAPSRRRALALAAVTGAGLLTHYFFVFTVAGGLVWLWIEPQARRSRLRTSIAVAAGLAVYIPWAPFMLRQYRQNRFDWIGSFQGRTVLETPLRLFTPLGRHGAIAIAAPLGLLAVAGVGSVVLARASARGRLYALLWSVPLALASTAWLVGFHIYAVRNMIGIGAFLAIAVAASLVALPAQARTAAAALVACAMIAGFVSDQQVPAASYKGFARALVAEGWKLHDPVAVFGNFFAFRSPLEWYLPGSPRLALVRDGRATCPPMFAIAGARSAPLVLPDSTARKTVGRFVVVQLSSASRPAFPDARILASPHPKC